MSEPVTARLCHDHEGVETTPEPYCPVCAYFQAYHDGRNAQREATATRLATLTRERDEAVALAARRLEQFNEQTRLAVEAWRESDVALAAMRSSRDEARTALAEAKGVLKEAERVKTTFRDTPPLLRFTKEQWERLAALLA